MNHLGYDKVVLTEDEYNDLMWQKGEYKAAIRDISTWFTPEETDDKLAAFDSIGEVIKGLREDGLL